MASYIDDLGIYATSFDQYLQRRPETMLQRLDSVDIRLNGAKCEFGQRSMQFLGHTVSELRLALLTHRAVLKRSSRCRCRQRARSYDRFWECATIFATAWPTWDQSQRCSAVSLVSVRSVHHCYWSWRFKLVHLLRKFTQPVLMSASVRSGSSCRSKAGHPS